MHAVCFFSCNAESSAVFVLMNKYAQILSKYQFDLYY